MESDGELTRGEGGSGGYCKHDEEGKGNRSLGLTAHLGWARLLVDIHRDLVQVPAAAGQHTSGSRNPHHFTPVDEETYEHENFFNPDTTPHYDSHSN